jgi:hypothetical protein
MRLWSRDQRERHLGVFAAISPVFTHLGGPRAHRHSLFSASVTLMVCNSDGLYVMVGAFFFSYIGGIIGAWVLLRTQKPVAEVRESRVN